MGMYTEIDYHVELVKGTPQEVIDVLKYMVRDGEKPAELPDHPFFSCDRWEYLFTMDSYYFAADTHSSLNYDEIGKRYTLNVRANLKNYGNEISHFLDWMTPYEDAHEGEFLGFYRYEESEDPTLIRAKGWEGIRPWETPPTKEEVEEKNYRMMLQLRPFIENNGDLNGYALMLPRGVMKMYEDALEWEKNNDLEKAESNE